MTHVEVLSQDIRRVDGSHDLGAGALAEKLVDLGWVKLPILTTYEELEAAQTAGTIIIDNDGRIYEYLDWSREPDYGELSGWYIGSDTCPYVAADIFLPAYNITILKGTQG